MNITVEDARRIRKVARAWPKSEWQQLLPELIMAIIEDDPEDLACYRRQLIKKFFPEIGGRA